MASCWMLGMGQCTHVQPLLIAAVAHTGASQAFAPVGVITMQLCFGPR